MLNTLTHKFRTLQNKNVSDGDGDGDGDGPVQILKT
jgi:hypothetical protein